MTGLSSEMGFVRTALRASEAAGRGAMHCAVCFVRSGVVSHASDTSEGELASKGGQARVLQATIAK